MNVLQQTKMEFYFYFIVIEDKNGQFEKEVAHWLKADFNEDKVLTKKEFLAFHHPESNQQTLSMMVDEITPSYDLNKDGVRPFSICIIFLIQFSLSIYKKFI